MKRSSAVITLAATLFLILSSSVVAQSGGNNIGATEATSGPVAEWVGDWWVEANGYGVHGTLPLGTQTNLWTSLPRDSQLLLISSAMDTLMSRFPGRHIYVAEIVGTGTRPEESLWFRMTYDADADVTTFTPDLS